VQWTKEQQNAIELPVSDMIVSAAAGSGKTAVMAERILRRLTSDADFVEIDKILVVTYTSAAASEIKERIMKKIMERLETEENPRLSNQLLKLPYAHISTIHSFCLDLIRKYFYLLGIDPAVKICDQTDVNIMKKSAAEMVMDNHYNADDSLFTSLVSDYSDKRDSSIGELLIAIYDFSRTMPDSEAWLASLYESYNDNSPQALKFLLDCTSLAGNCLIKKYDAMLDICEHNDECEITRNFLIAERAKICDALSHSSYSATKQAFDNITYENWRSAKCPESLRTTLKKKRDDAKKFAENSIIKKYLCLSEDAIIADNAHVASYVKKLSELASELGVIYDGLKREKNTIDFSDFEHLALSLLRNPDGSPSDIALSVAADFEEIYIDEYQDCNNIQNTIFECISGRNLGRPNVFCVGDMKQSIYSFRDSNPLLFRDKCDNYPLYDGAIVHECNKIFLNQNFRSRDSILRFVNSVFFQIMSLDCGELNYDANEMLNYGGGYNDDNPDIDAIDLAIIDRSNTFGDSYDPDYKSELSATEAEAVYVGKKIQKLISSGYMLHDKKNNETRKCTYRDIVILMRSAATPGPVFERVLSEMGIPVYSDKGAPYFETAEIRFLMSLLKVIDNPDDDIALASVMKNPVFGFDENMLLKIRLSSRKSSYYDCIRQYALSQTNSLSDKVNSFITRINEYYAKSRYMDTDEFLSYIINDLGYYTLLSLSPDSKLKIANVRYLLKKAREFELNNYRGIYSFVRFVENYGRETIAESAKILSSNDNVVRIMSIHKSKGLEFPVVFLSDLGRQFNTRDITSKIVMHKELGMGIESVYRNIGARFNTANMLAIKRKILFETVSEELRVLYVALTRPMEKLIMTASVKDGAALLSSAEDAVCREGEAIDPYLVLSSNRFINILLYAMIRSSGFPKAVNSSYKHVICDGCRYNVNLINISEIQHSAEKTPSENWQSKYDGPTSHYDSIAESLSHVYSHASSVVLPANMTVTEIKRLSAGDDEGYSLFDDANLAIPNEFGIHDRLWGASLGSLVHFCMEKLDFSCIESQADITEQLNALKEKGLISDAELQAIDTSAIFGFIQSDIGARMKAHIATLQKEYSFKYLADASLIFTSQSDDKIVVQGTVDAFFEDDDGCLVIVDYKTDKVPSDGSGVIADRYRTQLDYYAHALEAVFGKKVKEKLLYLFDTGETINITN